MAAVAEAPGTGVALPAQVQANPITKKLNKILDSKIETDQELLDALETVSPFLTENTLQRRRNLRRDLEQRSLETNIRFLNSFRKVRDAVEGVTKDVDEMSKCCEAMTNRLRATKEQTRDLLNQTTSLQNQSKRVEKRAEIVTAFLGAFQLKPEEAKALRGTADGGIDRNFFPALNRVREIHADCKQLLRTSQHAAALEIMEKMAAAHEAAYELLYRWIQRECRLLNVDFVDLNPLLYQAFEAMQERPVLFKYSLDEYNTARRSHVVRAFIDALTRGGPGGVPKPIELLSHDPLRYA
uniref:Conserved oligomeric Golgi complex subunit 6 n=1 Tax=Plectus sambesii TaxID=2011161 RepID=A0A914VS97_9BILA